MASNYSTRAYQTLHTLVHKMSYDHIPVPSDVGLFDGKTVIRALAFPLGTSPRLTAAIYV